MTDDRFWDCECEAGYVHSKAIHFCPWCNTSQEDGPDSRTSEILSQAPHITTELLVEILGLLRELPK